MFRPPTTSEHEELVMKVLDGVNRPKTKWNEMLEFFGHLFL